MAILKSRPDLEATIEVNGQPLEEYDDDDFDENNEKPNEMSKYIASVPGAKFTIRVQCTDRLFSEMGKSLAVDLLLDGETARKYAIDKDEFATRNDNRWTHTHMKERGLWYENNFTFSELETSKSTAL
jgi:hypothetical protein